MVAGTMFNGWIRGRGLSDWDSQDWASPPTTARSSDWDEYWVDDPGRGIDDVLSEGRGPTLLWLWLGLACAVAGLLLGSLVMVQAQFKLETIGTTAVVVVISGWLLSGVVAVLALAAYQRLDLRAAVSAYYSASPNAVALRTSVLSVAVLGVVANAYVFATWLAGR